jgi:RNA polymerase sigma-70 factor (ECF subfamily)
LIYKADERVRFSDPEGDHGWQNQYRPEKSESAVAIHHKAIYRYVLSIVGSPDEAEDLTQETFLRAHDKRSSLEDPAKLLPWLYRIATNACYDRLRQNSFGKRPQSLDERTDSNAESACFEPADKNAPRLDKLMGQDEMSTCVQKYLMDLPDTYRAVMILHDVEGLTNPEIAELLSISLATGKIRLHRAREKLRAALGDACSFSADERGVVVCEPKPTNIKI